jgi:hypothetical protein
MKAGSPFVFPEVLLVDVEILSGDRMRLLS